jgi:hypothetical protein
MSQEIRNPKKKSPGGFPTGLWFLKESLLSAHAKIPSPARHSRFGHQIGTQFYLRDETHGHKLGNVPVVVKLFFMADCNASAIRLVDQSKFGHHRLL